jgi:hypothetical protein
MAQKKPHLLSELVNLHLIRLISVFTKLINEFKKFSISDVGDEIKTKNAQIKNALKTNKANNVSRDSPDD